jgi:hypothetical protein
MRAQAELIASLHTRCATEFRENRLFPVNFPDVGVPTYFADLFKSRAAIT